MLHSVDLLTITNEHTGEGEPFINYKGEGKKLTVKRGGVRRSNLRYKSHSLGEATFLVTGRRNDCEVSAAQLLGYLFKVLVK